MVEEATQTGMVQTVQGAVQMVRQDAPAKTVTMAAVSCEDNDNATVPVAGLSVNAKKRLRKKKSQAYKTQIPPESLKPAAASRDPWTQRERLLQLVEDLLP